MVCTVPLVVTAVFNPDEVMVDADWACPIVGRHVAIRQHVKHAAESQGQSIGWERTIDLTIEFFLSAARHG